MITPVQKKLVSKCPLKDRRDHSGNRPATLTETGMKHINHQIQKNGHKALPYRIPGEHFYQCRDCCAVWLAASPYAVVSESEVLGIYSRELVWKPYP